MNSSVEIETAIGDQPLQDTLTACICLVLGFCCVVAMPVHWEAAGVIHYYSHVFCARPLADSISILPLPSIHRCPICP